jgi:hypothetical protein
MSNYPPFNPEKLCVQSTSLLHFRRIFRFLDGIVHLLDATRCYQLIFHFPFKMQEMTVKEFVEYTYLQDF